MSQPKSKPFTLFDLYAFLGQKLGAYPELANLYIAGLDMSMVLSNQTTVVPPKTLSQVHSFYSDLDALVDDGIAYIEANMQIASTSSREDMEQASKKGIH